MKSFYYFTVILFSLFVFTCGQEIADDSSDEKATSKADITNPDETPLNYVSSFSLEFETPNGISNLSNKSSYVEFELETPNNQSYTRKLPLFTSDGKQATDLFFAPVEDTINSVNILDEDEQIIYTLNDGEDDDERESNNSRSGHRQKPNFGQLHGNAIFFQFWSWLDYYLDRNESTQSEVSLAFVGGSTVGDLNLKIYKGGHHHKYPVLVDEQSITQTGGTYSGAVFTVDSGRHRLFNKSLYRIRISSSLGSKTFMFKTDELMRLDGRPITFQISDSGSMEVNVPHNVYRIAWFDLTDDSNNAETISYSDWSDNLLQNPNGADGNDNWNTERLYYDDYGWGFNKMFAGLGWSVHSGGGFNMKTYPKYQTVLFSDQTDLFAKMNAGVQVDLKFSDEFSRKECAKKLSQWRRYRGHFHGRVKFDTYSMNVDFIDEQHNLIPAYHFPQTIAAHYGNTDCDTGYDWNYREFIVEDFNEIYTAMSSKGSKIAGLIFSHAGQAAESRINDGTGTVVKDSLVSWRYVTGVNTDVSNDQSSDDATTDSSGDAINTNTYNLLFLGANLTGANFYNASIVNADFRGANLAQVNFTGADVSGANFDGSYNFTRSMLDGSVNVDMITFNTEESKTGYVTPTHNYVETINQGNYSYQDISGGDLSNTSLINITYIYATGSNVNFISSNLTGANFTYTAIDNIDYSNALMIGANFTHANNPITP